MKLLMLKFEVHEEDQEPFVEVLTPIKESLLDKGISFQLLRDSTHRSRFLLQIETDMSVDEVSQLIQSDSEMRELMETIKNVAGHVVVSFYEQMIVSKG